MNLFSTDGYLLSLAEVYFPGRDPQLRLFTLEGRQYRLLVIDGKQIITDWPFLDFVQALEPRLSAPARPIGYLPRAVVRTTLAEDRPATYAPERRPSPFIEWGRFPEWDAFEAMVSARIGNLFPDSRRKRKKVERDLGPLRFTFDDPDPAAFDRCVRWKSSQYVATGLTDMFADSRNVEMFRVLRRRQVAVVSSLSAGDTLLAVHLGGQDDRRHYWWVPAYDPALSKYSPGRLLLEELLRESHRRGHSEFDFLIGEEAYKWHYATHNREVGPVGETPLAVRWRREAKRRLKGALERYPPLLELAREVKKRL